MRAVVALAVIAACGGRGPTTPQSRPVVRLVGCAAASPPPHAGADDKVGQVQYLEDEIDGVVIRLASKRTVAIGNVSVPGADANAIAAKLRGATPALLRCYTSGPERAAVIYKVTIGASGVVLDVRTTAASFDHELDACIRRTIGGLAFPLQRTTVEATVPLVFDANGGFRLNDGSAPKSIETAAWTPFAIDTTAAGVAATRAARVAESAVRARLAALDACFGAAAPTGSLRVMLELGVGGDLDSVRAGGLGDPRAEHCVAEAFAGLHMITPVDEHVEIACDLARGDAQPWRVARDGYAVIEADRTQLRNGNVTIVPGVGSPDPLPVHTYLIVAKPDTPGAVLQLALLWAGDARSVVIALDDGGAAPLFLGLGQTSVGTDDTDDALRPALRVNGAAVTGCLHRATREVKVGDVAAVDALVARMAAKCHSLACTPTLVVGVDSDARVKDLVAIAGAARRNNFDRVLFGGSELACLAARKAADPTPPVTGPDD